MKALKSIILVIIACGLLIQGCESPGETTKPRLSMFIGVDISGSYKNTKHFDDSLDFLSYYIYSHLNGLGGLEVPNVLYVSSIGGARVNEPKTFYPIQSFEKKSVSEIRQKLDEIFPRNISNPFTDYNAFFEQVAHMVKNKNLVLRPISVIMITDGIPDVKQEGITDFASIQVTPLEKLARNVTIRLLYTSPVTGRDWETKVKRRRVKIWTQDADVLHSWKDPDIMAPEKQIDEQDYFFAWVKDNVDFGVRSRRVD
jgi:hypothetical protein